MTETAQPKRTVADIEPFITMLSTACEDDSVNRRLERLLSMPDQKRRAVIHAWINDLLIAEAPSDFVQAIGCLLDDAVAEKAYEVIYRCKRTG